MSKSLVKLLTIFHVRHIWTVVTFYSFWHVNKESLPTFWPGILFIFRSLLYYRNFIFKYHFKFFQCFYYKITLDKECHLDILLWDKFFRKKSNLIDNRMQKKVEQPYNRFQIAFLLEKILEKTFKTSKTSLPFGTYFVPKVCKCFQSKIHEFKG